MNNEAAQEKYGQLKMLDEQIQEYQKYIQEVDQQIQTLNEVIGWVNDVQSVEKGSETFIPLANGIFIKGTITDAKKFYVNVGEKTIIPKTPESTITMLEGQIETLTVIREQTVVEFQKALEQAQKIEEEVRKQMGEE